MKTVLYMHGGSGNHGCEALVRTTTKIAKDATGSDVILWSQNVSEDYKYGVSNVVDEIVATDEVNKKSLSFLWSYFKFKILKKSDALHKLFIKKLFKDSVAISIGGDNIISGALANALGVGKVVTEENKTTKTTGLAYTSGTVFVTVTTNFHDNEVVSSLSMPEKDTLLKSVDYIDASACEDILNVSSLPYSKTTYKITSTEGLQKLATLVNEGKYSGKSTFVLMNDIDLSSIDEWTPIGEEHCFDGIF